MKKDKTYSRTIEFEVSLDKYLNERMRVKLRTNKQELIDVVYQYESFINDKWQAIVRYDCAHGFFHRDVLSPNGEKEKTEMTFDNMKDASRYAAQDIKDRWEWYREKYAKKMTNKETVQRNLGLTFDFVEHLIKNPELTEALPDKFKLDFVEQDFSKTERLETLQKQNKTWVHKRVKVKNTFEMNKK